VYFVKCTGTGCVVELGDAVGAVVLVVSVGEIAGVDEVVGVDELEGGSSLLVQEAHDSTSSVAITPSLRL